jgi:signal transduction histidine kinase
MVKVAAYARTVMLDPVDDSVMGLRTSHDRIVDGALFAAALIAAFLLWGTTVEAAEPLSPSEGLLALADAGAGLLLTIALWWRRRLPVALAVVGTLVSFWSAAAAPAALVLLWTVATRRSLRTTMALTPLLLTSALVYPLVHPDPSLPYVWDVVVGAVFLIVVVIAALYVRVRRELQAVLLEQAERAVADREMQVVQARELERARIAREMHDVLGHRLSLVSMHAGALEYRPDAAPDELAQAVSTIRRNAHQALQDLRDVLGVLRTDNGGELRPQPTLADLPALVEESRDAGLHIAEDYKDVDVDAVPTVIGRTAYRIVQEGLTNVRKHADGAIASVRVRGSPGSALIVEVCNPLPRSSTRDHIPGAGTGLVGLAERAELAGGQLRYGPTASGRQFRLWASLPWPA